MLKELLATGSNVAMIGFVVSSMLAMGLSLTLAQILQPLRNYRLVTLALLANFVAMPLIAVALGRLLGLEEPFAVGLLLLGCAAGAPFLPKLAQLSKGDIAFSVGSMVLLMVVTVAYLPVVLPLLLPGVSVDPIQIAKSLVVLMLLPLGIGLAAKSRAADFAQKAKPFLEKLSNISLIVLIVCIVGANISSVLEVFGTMGIFAGLLFIVAGFLVGWLLGGSNAETKRVMALGTSQRNIAAALVVAGQSFTDPKVVVMVVVVAILGMVTLMPFARKLGAR